MVGCDLIFVGLVILACDQTASHFIKNLVLRLRPSHEPALAGLIHLGKAGPGWLYGFVSSHAANAFGLATFLYFVLDDRFKNNRKSKTILININSLHRFDKEFSVNFGYQRRWSSPLNVIND